LEAAPSPLASQGRNLRAQKSSGWERVAAFGFGVVFVSAMFVVAFYLKYPTEFQIFVFRIILALAAAGIGAVIPGFITLNVGKYVRAGGAMGLFAIVYWFNPSGLVTDFTPFTDSIRRGEAALALDSHTAALEHFTNAAQTRPKSWIPYHGLARVKFRQGNFAAAEADFRKAFDLQGRSDGLLIYGLGMAQESLGKFDEAAQSFHNAYTLLDVGSVGSPMSLDALFDEALNRLLLWLKHHAPLNAETYQQAIDGFEKYKSKRGTPAQWANYHLACLKATRAGDRELTPQEVDSLRNSANTLLETSIDELRSLQSVKSHIQRQLMHTLLLRPDSVRRNSGDPVPCPALRTAWQQRGSIDQLATRLM
jgi:hypothetical protein